MLRGERSYRVISITDAAGAPVLGLTLAALVIAAYARAYGAGPMAVYTHSAALVEIGSGDYELSFLAPPSAGWFSVTARPVNPLHFVWDSRWAGEVEANDLDSIQISVSAGAVTPPGNLLLGWTYAGSLVAYRYNLWSLPIVDANGAAVDLPALYSNLRLAVRSLNQTTRKLDATDGSPTGFVLQSSPGLLTIGWPESTGTLGSVQDIYAHLAVGELTAASPLYFEVTGDLGGDATKTVPIIRSSPLMITRREVET